MRQVARQLSTATRSRPAPRVGAYAAATVLVGTTIGLAVGYPGLKDRFIVKADAAKVPDSINRDIKDGHKRGWILSDVLVGVQFCDTDQE